MNRIHAALVVSLCALPLAAQSQWEIYQGRAVIARQVLVRLRVPSQAATDALRQALDADSVRQIGGTSGPHVFHSRSQSAAQLVTSLAGRSDLQLVEPDFVVR